MGLPLEVATEGSSHDLLQRKILRYWIAVFIALIVTDFSGRVLRSPLSVSVERAACPAAVCIAVWVLVERGYVRFGALLLSFGMTFCVMLSAAHAGGIAAAGIPTFVIPLVIAAFTLGRTELVVLFFAMAVYVFGVAILEKAGALPTPIFIHSPLYRATIYLLVGGSVGAMVWWATDKLELGKRLLIEGFEEKAAMEKQVRILNQELEERVKQRTEDLDAFIGMVAHDLKTPVIHVKSYSKLLQEKGDVFDEESKFFVSRLALSATNMSELIDDLLEFSRRRRHGLKRTEVDMNELVALVRYEFVESGAIDPAWIEISELPSADSDIALVKQVWTNLIDNAIKYSRNCDVPKVRIYAETIIGETWYVVQDNGVGFSSSDAERIFEEFAFDDQTNELAGMRVGLSNVRRIVQCHGGRVAATGEIDKGAKISFTIPSRQDHVMTGDSVLKN